MSTTPRYIVGAIVKIKSEFVDSSGLAIDPTTVVMKYKAPDNTVTTMSSPTRTDTGLYEQLVTLSQAGKYVFRWEGSGNSGAVNESVIMVQASQVI